MTSHETGFTFSGQTLSTYTTGQRLIPETRRGTIYVTNIFKFLINTCDKPRKLSTWTNWRLIPVTSQENYLSFSGQRSIPETRQDKYLLNQLMLIQLQDFWKQFTDYPNMDVNISLIQIQLLKTVYGCFPTWMSICCLFRIQIQIQLQLRYVPDTDTIQMFILLIFQQTFLDGIYKPISDKILSHLQMASLSPFPQTTLWRVQIYEHSSVQSSFTFESRTANSPI